MNRIWNCCHFIMAMVVVRSILSKLFYLTGTVLDTYRSCNIMFFSRASKCHDHQISVAINVFIAESGSYLIFCHLWTDRKVEQLYRHDKFYHHQLIYNIFIYKINTSRYQLQFENEIVDSCHGFIFLILVNLTMHDWSWTKTQCHSLSDVK